MGKDKIPLPRHYSGVRHMVFQKLGKDYLPLETFNECRSYDDVYVILEGDDGGMIYLTSPFNKVRCAERDLNILLDELDRLAWGGKNRDCRRVYYERYDFTGNENNLILIPGGLGGGFVTPERIWIHERFNKPGLPKRIKQVLTGERTTIGG